MPQQPNFLSQEYTIDTPEGVAFGYEVAGIGSRFIAALIDSSAVAVVLVLLNVILVAVLWLIGETAGADGTTLPDEAEIGWAGGLLLAVYVLLNFAIFWGYYILFEYLWNGQTPGKRMAGIRVVRTDGNPVGLSETVIRNLVRIVDFLPTGYGLGLVVMFLNRQDRRLGDFAAGTLVIREAGHVSLENLASLSRAATPTAANRPTVDLLMAYPNVRRLSPRDYDLLQDALRRDRRQQLDQAIVHRLARALAAKLDMEPPSQENARQFLLNMADAYRHVGRRELQEGDNP